MFKDGLMIHTCSTVVIVVVRKLQFLTALTVFNVDWMVHIHTALPSAAGNIWKWQLWQCSSPNAWFMYMQHRCRRHETVLQLLTALGVSSVKWMVHVHTSCHLWQETSDSDNSDSVQCWVDDSCTNVHATLSSSSENFQFWHLLQCSMMGWWFV